MAVSAAVEQQGNTFKASPSSRPFSGFERLVAWRYLRSRRKEASISVIAGFSLVGIMLGVAALIIVMAVMNGFRTELISRILGINGHMIVQPVDGTLNDYADMAARFSKVAGVKLAIPFVDGQVLAQGKGGNNSGALVRGIRAEDLSKLKLVSDNIREGDLIGSHFASGGSSSQPSLIEIQAAVDEATQQLSEAVAASERLGFEISRLEADRLAAQQRVDVALAKLHESDATLAAVAEELGQYGSQARAARGEAERLAQAIEKARPLSPSLSSPNSEPTKKATLTMTMATRMAMIARRSYSPGRRSEMR